MPKRVVCQQRTTAPTCNVILPDCHLDQYTVAFLPGPVDAASAMPTVIQTGAVEWNFMQISGKTAPSCLGQRASWRASRVRWDSIERIIQIFAHLYEANFVQCRVFF